MNRARVDIQVITPKEKVCAAVREPRRREKKHMRAVGAVPTGKGMSGCTRATRGAAVPRREDGQSVRVCELTREEDLPDVGGHCRSAAASQLITPTSPFP